MNRKWWNNEIMKKSKMKENDNENNNNERIMKA